MDPCSCKRGAKAVYYCTVVFCPNHKKRPTYCKYCIQAKVHNHENITVASVVDSWEGEFKQTEVDITLVYNRAKEQFAKFENLIKMCERLTFNNRSDFISKHWEVFKVLYF